MPRIRRFILRLYNFCRPAAAEVELSRELESHLVLLEEDFRRDGMKDNDARVMARRVLGGVQQARERHRDARSFQYLEECRRDLYLAFRTLSKQPIFALVVVLTLALGIGSTIAIFSLANALWLRPLHAPRQERLVRFAETWSGTAPTQVTGPTTYALWKDRTTTFESLAAHWLEFANVTQAAFPEQVAVGRVTASFFEMFGTSLAAGRLFTSAEDRPGGPPVALISADLWRRQYLSTPAVIGRTFMLGGQPRTVIGVIAPSFQSQQFEQEPDVWIPIQFDDNTPNAGNCIVSGRLKPGVTIGSANAQLAVIADSQPNHRQGHGAIVLPLRDALVGEARTPVLILGAAGVLLLLIASANVAALLLVRALDRRREVTIQAALGAGRGRIVRQVLTESLLLGIGGGAVGLVLGLASIKALLNAYEHNNWLGGTDGFIPRLSETLSDVTLDWRVAAFATTVTVVAAAMFGVLPALLASRLEINEALKGTPRRGGMRSTFSRCALVIAQIALTAVLLTAAGLLVRTSVALLSVNRGYDLEHVLTLRMAIKGTRFDTPAGLEQLNARGTEAVRQIPGVASVTTSCCVPLDVVWQLLFVIEGRPLNGTFHGVAGFTFASPTYFETLGIPVLRGRGMTDQDSADAAPVIVINEAMAKQFWPNADPLGRFLVIGHGMHTALDQDKPRQIVGIVGNVREQRLNTTPRPAMYVPATQLPAAVLPFLFEQQPVAWMIRTIVDPRSVAPAVQRAVERAADGLPVARVRSMREVAAASIVRTQFDMYLMLIFGLSAACMAALGVYGFVSLVVKQRLRDFGIRMALGARAGDVRGWVWSRGLALAAVGIALGSAGAWVSTHVLESLLFGVTPHDAAVFSIVATSLAVLVAGAMWAPVRRAGDLEPAVLLRDE